MFGGTLSLTQSINHVLLNDVQIETHFVAMYTRPMSAEQCLHNALCVISAMKSAGIEYDIQVSISLSLSSFRG